MSLKIYLDGKFVPEEDASVSVFDHGYLYGDGVFEGIRAYSGKVFKLDEHVRRLYDSARAIMLEIPMPPQEMAAKINEAVNINGLTDAYIRVVVSRGKGDLGLDPRKCPRPTVVIIAASIQLYPQELYDKGLEVVSVPTNRIPNECLNPRIKSLNYLNNILAKIEGINAGVIEVVMLNRNGYVAECSGDNIFCIRDGVIRTPPVEAGILLGITRGTVIDLARSKGLQVIETNLNRFDLYVSDEVFLTGTAAEVIGVVKVDGRAIGSGKPGEITRTLKAAFEELVRS
ncbi:MAG: branched-chain-amino-acid transaminase [Planctomycetes bacterium]|nr:branched-chain-amino-acid transaminase [Planctomycetota bacterium]